MDIKNFKIINKLFCNRYTYKFKYKSLPLYYKFTSMFKGNGTDHTIRTDYEVIISLTSIPSRIDKLWLCVESLLRQSFKPNKIILWLSDEKFCSNKLPQSLKKQQKRGLEIRYCKDLKSHTKYYYTLKENPNQIIVTVDDDIYYSPNMLKDLIDVHNKYPNQIICHRAHKITFNEDGTIKRYNDWGWESPKFNGPSNLLLQTGVSGVLYPPKSLYKDVLNKEKFLDICPKADDVWLKVMALLNNTQIRKVRADSVNFHNIEGTQGENLWSYNISSGGNDKQLIKLIEEYKIDYKKFDD